MKGSSERRGSALVFALVTSILLVAMVGALSMVAAKESEVVSGTRELERSRLITETGLNLVVEDYQKDQAPPPKDWYDNPQDFGDGTYQILSDTALAGPYQRRLIEVEGVYDASDWRIQAVIGPVVKPLFDAAIQANDDITLRNNPGVDSYDSRIGPYPSGGGDGGDIKGNGDLTLENNSDVMGDVEVVGTLTIDGSSSVSGGATGNGDSVPLDSVDALVATMVAKLSAFNDNATIDPTMVVMIGGEPAIQLPTNRTKTLTSGDYYLHSLRTGNNSNLVFDTTGGPIRIVAHTGDVYLGRNSDFVVTGTEPVYIYLSGVNKFEMDNLSHVLNPWGRADLFQVVINSNDPGFPRFDMGQNTQFFGTVWAPNVDVILRQSADVFGAVIGREVALANFSTVHYDEALLDGQWILIPDSFRVYFKRRVI